MEKGQLYRLLGAVGLGQFASLLVTFTGLTSSILAREGIDAPTSQSFCNYVLLALFYGCTFLRSKKLRQVPWYYYILLAFVDVEANYLVVRAYQYTSLTSVMLLDCWTIPCVILLTWLFMKTKYKIGQLIGAFICVLGLVLVVLSDVHANDRSGGSNAILGDTLVIIGSTLYAVSNVSEELLINKVDFIELMAFLGFFGALISAGQMFILEWQELKSINWTQGAVLPFIGFAVSLFLFYTVVPIILKLSGSALLNLSLLTSDMWAVLIRVFAYHQKVDWLFFIAFATVAVGLSTYTARTHPSNDVKAADDGKSMDSKELRQLEMGPVKIEEHLVMVRDDCLCEVTRGQSSLGAEKEPPFDKTINVPDSKNGVLEEVTYEQVVTTVEEDRESQEAEDLIPSTGSKNAKVSAGGL